MFKNVLVGVDGAAGGRDALALAGALADKSAGLTLAYVYYGEAHAWRSYNPAYEAVERDRAHELLQRARAEANVEARLRCHRAPSVGRGLHELAESVGADLLVIGSSRRGTIGRVLIGDDTRSALGGAPCAVAIAPAGFAEEPTVMREIGVGYDASPESETALQAGRRLARQLGSKLSAFEAVSIPTYAFMGIVDVGALDELVEDAHERVASLEGVEPHAAYGDAAEELALYSASIDLLVIGSRNYGPVGRLVHGSTAQQLARRARCPLLVLPRAAAGADTPDASTDGREAAATTAR